jgi:hypothetical protein
MDQLTKEQAQMVALTVVYAHRFKQPLPEYVAETIAKLEADASHYRDKAFEGGRVKRSKLGWHYERSAQRLAAQAAAMRDLRNRFASWQGLPCNPSEDLRHQK